MKSSTYYFHMKTKICISVPLMNLDAWIWCCYKNRRRGEFSEMSKLNKIFHKNSFLGFWNKYTAWKMSKFGVFSGSYFFIFGLNAFVCRGNLFSENKDQKKLRIGLLFTQWYELNMHYIIKQGINYDNIIT